jgi:cytochrome c oxidase cbb3-type subunit 3/ubiquinol-cytochrome c reductase cytochrome c subunit
MNLRVLTLSMMTCAAAFVCAGCKDVPGRPGAAAKRPDQVLNFSVLYSENCAACHGDNGKNGAAISLANPVYLAVAGAQQIQQITENGVPGTLMPAFAKSQGGMLTDQQIVILAQGLESKWGSANALGGQAAPSYASSAAGDPARGQKAFSTFCASCHGADGTGVVRGKLHTGSLVDPAYLALISDQGLRSLIIAGQPQEGMPDWRSDLSGAGARAMTDQEITDTVAWLASHRVTAPGQPYTHP